MCENDEKGAGVSLADLLKAAHSAERKAAVNAERERIVRLALASLIVENSHVARDLRANGLEGSDNMARALDTESMMASEMLSGRFVFASN